MVCNTVLQCIAAHNSLWVRPLCCNVLQIIANHNSLWVRPRNFTHSMLKFLKSQLCNWVTQFFDSKPRESRARTRTQTHICTHAKTHIKGGFPDTPVKTGAPHCMPLKHTAAYCSTLHIANTCIHSRKKKTPREVSLTRLSKQVLHIACHYKTLRYTAAHCI